MNTTLALLLGLVCVAIVIDTTEADNSGVEYKSKLRIFNSSKCIYKLNTGGIQLGFF